MPQTPAPPPPADPRAARGRGALSNAVSRFDRFTRALEDDGWGVHDPDPPALATTLTPDATRTIIARNSSPDISFTQSINPYRGCEHGCVYCYARPSHAYLGLSPGLDFESRLFVKPEAAALLARELRAPGYKAQTIALGTNTDPYQPAEKRLSITRAVLEVLAAFRHPVAIVTKSHLVTRDIDVLAPMAAQGLAKVALSVTTLDRGLARAMEPRAATPQRRIEALRLLSEAGVPTGVMAAPMIPGLNDSELEAILEAAAGAGARQAGYIVLRLPREISALFQEWLAAQAPDRAGRVMKLVREMRGGRDYDPAFGRRMTGAGPYAALLAQRFRVAAARLGLNAGRTPLATDLFRPPPQAGDQLALL